MGNKDNYTHSSRPTAGEVLFVSGCVALVLVAAATQMFVVLDVPPESVRLPIFLVPAMVGVFFGTSLVLIRRLRESVERQHQEIVRLSEQLSRDLHKTDQKLRTAHKELEHSERLKVVGLLGAQVAHDFNNLLTTIMFAASEVEPGASNADLKESQSLILDASGKAAGLCTLLLGFSKPSKIESPATSLDVVLEEMQHILRKLVSHDVSFHIKRQPDLPLVAADRGRIEMCLLNLVINSNDALPASSIAVETRSNGDHVELSVTDNGEGMDAETLAKVMQPFFTTKGKGTGLGLSVVSDAMEQAGGGMEIVSNPGQGTTVSLRFKPAL